MTHQTPPPNANNAGKAPNGNNAGKAPNDNSDETAKASIQTPAKPVDPAQNQAGSSGKPAKTTTPTNPSKRGVQRTVTYIEPISALKMALIFNLALFAVWFVAMALIYIVLGAAGTWDRLDSLIGDLTNSSGLSAGMYFGGVAAIGLFEVVLFTLLAPIAALIYNASSSILGGVRIQLDR
ncbi:DUF3566 domain-containing protein [uncultured Corynebacterium sp.]|uniref:DUF3566 domain-containing protein n=1 Tax=uncultured Corynebacterium sp. TaxID=159447 RepID=UPI0025F6203E|nr:DUF3566 domain-containing protein [uncultured Corynebacterium sp.]